MGIFRIKKPFFKKNSKYPLLYHYEKQRKGEKSRIHLRIDHDGSGLILINANRVLHLNPTAAFMARLILEEKPHDQAIKTITKRYEIEPGQAQDDYLVLQDTLNELIRPDGACPVHEMDLEIIPPFSTTPSAPYRMDLAVTYRCNNDCAHCYNARPRDFPELSTEHWKKIIDRVWSLGIPHVVFTGGEPTLRDDLPELIAYAEETGLITGINTNGRRLSDANYIKKLVEAGLDHAQITVESYNPETHDHMVRSRGAWRQTIRGLENALNSPLYIMTNTTMLRDNRTEIANTLDFLSNKGVPTVGLNALIYAGAGLQVGTGLSESELFPLLEMAREHTQSHNQKLIWYTPTQYCNFDPQQLELGVKGCTAALYNMCIEPDGGVIPCQSYYKQLGNILIDSWDSIWNHDLALSLRERRYVQEECHDCVLLAECGGGCPLLPQTPLPNTDLYFNYKQSEVFDEQTL